MSGVALHRNWGALMKSFTRARRRRFQWLAAGLVAIAVAAVALTAGYSQWFGLGNGYYHDYGSSVRYYYPGPHEYDSYYRPYSSYYYDPYYYSWDSYWRSYDSHYADLYPHYLDYAIAGNQWYGSSASVNNTISINNTIGYPSWWYSWGTCGQCGDYSWYRSPWVSANISQSANVNISTSITQH